jgi:release factor glutamine methyltransferase
MKQLNDAMRETRLRLNGTLGEFALPYTERIFEHLLGCSRNELYAAKTGTVDALFLEQLETIVLRCGNHEPLDYILGVSYFFNREFAVSPSVLIPRPDTETLIEQILQHEDDHPHLFADIGTGSGIIAAILTEQRTAWSAIATDISPDALEVARTNRRTDRLHLVCCNLLDAVPAAAHFDFIASNPPYIKTGDIRSLDKSVRDFEPATALDGGNDGLDFYRAIARDAPQYLKPGGRVYCEIGFDQEAAVTAIFTHANWEDCRVVRDLGGKPRVFIAHHRGIQTHG